MALSKTYGWLEVDRIGEALHAAHPGIDPLRVRFTELRRLVEGLPDFKEEPGHPVNERILEAIQMSWREEREDNPPTDDEDDDD